MASNTAAWITGPKVSPLEVKEAPYPTPGPQDVIVQTAAVAVNPLEYKIQDRNPPINGKELQYPRILGADLAGTVVSVGSNVSTCKAGDRVIANASGAEAGSFQQFVKLPKSSITPLPDNISFEAGAVLPLGCDTAMAGLFVEDKLGLSTARLGDTASAPPPSSSVVLIWGGSSSIGCCAIQMARAAGYQVYTTASNHNHSLCSSLGATEVFDHSDRDVEAKIVEALQDKALAGALDCITNEKTASACARISARAGGVKKVVTVLNPPDISWSEGVEAQRLSIPAMRAGKTYTVVHEWMASALESGLLKPEPDPIVVGEGLASIQLGIDTVRRGVSAAKVVVRL